MLRVCSLSVLKFNAACMDLPLGHCLNVIVYEKPLNLEMTTSIVLSVLLLIYVVSFLLNLSYPNFSLFFRNIRRFI